eukprot:TRINITY_DN3228_c0_g1_i3.p1 TRINITY_DN3228_c0_g1~~TRINITY_DN3228_c0_g1_i3.p1  ORF type:complete len:288 (+),score=47.50 TRINITY_DN3228_c0_g1_i3:106-969(+)
MHVYCGVCACRYGVGKMTGDLVERALYSIGDNHAYLRGSRDPVDQMIRYLEEYFSPNSETSDAGIRDSLAIRMGTDGARLTHNHTRQYHYVLQSMILWREVMHDMFRLWTLAENDLLDESTFYRLRDTGQGLNRVQPCPRVSRSMHAIVDHTMRRVGYDNWVGSSVIHLGDHNVPNALTFIDKYTQVPRILNPLAIGIVRLDEVTKDPEVANYVERAFGSVKNLRRIILGDFFRHAFDGSGADNFFDAGSCIDGRLTSAWHWCSKVEKKDYFPVLLLTGFVGFDGDF